MEAVVFQKINNLALNNMWLDTLGIFFAEFFPYVVIISLFFFLFFGFKKYGQMIVLSLAAATLSRSFTEIIRIMIDRPRPLSENANLLFKLESSAFPSGHSAFFFALSTIIFSYNKKAGILFFGFSTLITLSRVYCGVHRPLDILSGFFVGIVSAVLMIKVFKFLKK